MGLVLDLSGPRSRLAWAKEHTSRVEEVVADSLGGKRGSDLTDVHAEFDPELGCFKVICDSAPMLPKDVGLMVGDALHNLRSSLDHLAWILVRAGHEPNPQWPRKVEFPICDTSRDFKGGLRKALPGVRGDHRREIRLVQPYQGGKVSRTLASLRDLNNADKHRLTHPQVVAVVHAHLTYKAHDATDLRAIDPGVVPPRFEPKAELLRLSGRIIGPKPEVEIGAGDLHPAVLFENDIGVLEHLEAAYEAITAILDSFDRDWPTVLTHGDLPPGKG